MKDHLTFKSDFLIFFFYISNTQLISSAQLNLAECNCCLKSMENGKKRAYQKMFLLNSINL